MRETRQHGSEGGGPETNRASLPLLRFPLADHSRSGRRLSPNERLAYDSARVRLIEQWKPKLVVVCRRWTSERPGGLDELVDFLCGHAEKVLLVEQPPEIAGLKDRNLVQFLAHLGITPCDGVSRYLPILDPARGEKARELVRHAAMRNRKCSLIAVHDLYARGDEVLVLKGRQAIYTDDDHLTTYGAGLAAERFREAILASLSESQPQ
ncbi:MAG: SGNH hydrolase domain-containing protein [Planctomycetia bacterium]